MLIPNGSACRVLNVSEKLCDCAYIISWSKVLGNLFKPVQKVKEQINRQTSKQSLSALNETEGSEIGSVRAPMCALESLDRKCTTEGSIMKTACTRLNCAKNKQTNLRKP